MMNETPELSVIIPVYNVERYLEKCLGSILNQTFENYEVLLINDGSIDNSGAICDQYAADDSRVKVIHKANEGVSPTRNLGIKQSIGKYLWYIDGDDWLPNNAVFETLMNEVKKYDMPDTVVFNCDLKIYTARKNTSSSLKFVHTTNSYKSVNEYFEAQPMLPNYVWCQLYRRQFLLDCGFSFYGDLYEDTLFNLDVYSKTNRLIALEKNLYVHIKRPDSLTTAKVTFKHLDLAFNLTAKICELHRNNKLNLKVLKERLDIEYESISKLVIKLNFTEPTLRLFEIQVKSENISFIKDFRSGFLRSIGMAVFNKSFRTWIEIVPWLFRIGIFEKKFRRLIGLKA